MLHAREFALGTARIRIAKVIRHYQTQHRIAEKLERFVMQFTGVQFITGRNLFMGPRTVRDGPLKQCTITKLVSQNCFEEVQIRDRGCKLFQDRSDYNKRRKLV